jgi:hypothetical protein
VRVQLATTAVKAFGSKVAVKEALGAILGLLVAWAIALICTSSYGDEEEASSPRPVLSRPSD